MIAIAIHITPSTSTLSPHAGSNARKRRDALWAPDNPLSEHGCLRKQHDASQHRQSCFAQDCENPQYPYWPHRSSSMVSNPMGMALTMSYHSQSWTLEAGLSFDVLRKHIHHPQSITHDNISYMRYGVRSNELLDKFFYYNPCTSAWIVRESNTQAEKSVIPCLEEEAKSSGGLNYRGIFHPSITFVESTGCPPPPWLRGQVYLTAHMPPGPWNERRER